MRNRLTKMFLVGAVLAAMFSALIVACCANNAEPREGREPAAAAASQSVSGGEVNQSGGESGPDGPEGQESGGAGSEAAIEAAMSSPIIPLDQTWNGVLDRLAVSASVVETLAKLAPASARTTPGTLSPGSPRCPKTAAGLAHGPARSENGQPPGQPMSWGCPPGAHPVRGSS